MENQVEQDPATVSSELAALKAEVARLSDRVKENQTGMFSAIRTLADDLIAYHQGRRELHQLQPAVLGLVFAYLRPRLVIAAGGLVALVIGILQLSVLFRQNKLIEQQGVFLEEQTRANQISAITALVMALDPRDSVRNHLAQTQLARFGETGVDVLLDLSGTPGPGSELAAGALYAQGSIHSAPQVRAVLGQWAVRTASALEDPSLGFTEPDVGLRNYVRTLADRVRSDSRFASELGDELGRPAEVVIERHDSTVSKFQPSFPTQLVNLYTEYLTRCAPDHNPSSCTTPSWHHSMFSLGLNIRGVGPGFAPESDSAFHALVDLMAESAREENNAPKTTIASWFLGESTVSAAKQVARERPQ